MIEEKELKLKNQKLIIWTSLGAAFIVFIINLVLNYFILKVPSFYHIKNLLLPIAVILIAYNFLIIKNKMIINKKAYWYLIPITLILIGSAFLSIPLNNEFLNIFALPILSAMFLLTLTNKNYDSLFSPLSSLFKLFPNGLFKNLKYLKITKNKNKSGNGLNVFYGLLVGIPIAIAVLGLLISADKYFSEFIIKLFGPIWNLKIYEGQDIINIFITALITFSVFINVIKSKGIKNEERDIKEINTTSSTIVLSIINSVFLIFIVSEVSKLTNNFLQLPIQYTYAEYAREGFFQLLLVTAINFLVINYHTYKTKGFEKNKLIKGLLLLLISFSIILIFNSYYRMFLYIGAYGFTTLRMQVILFLLMELILFSILIKKVTEKVKHNYKGLFMIIMIAFYVLNIYMASYNFLNFLKTF